MSAFNNYLQQALRDHFKNGTQLPLQDTYLGIATQDPGETGSLIGEPTGAWYSRQQINTTGGATPTFTSAATGTGFENAQTVLFPTATTTPGSVSHFFLITTTTGGTGQNMLFYTSADTARSIASGDEPKFSAGNVQFTFD
jgi:hypothetical protein